MEAINTREKDWRQTVDKLNEELQTMEKHLLNREREQSEQIKTLESKNSALLADLKYLKQENDRLKERSKDHD